MYSEHQPRKAVEVVSLPKGEKSIRRARNNKRQNSPSSVTHFADKYVVSLEDVKLLTKKSELTQEDLIFLESRRSTQVGTEVICNFVIKSYLQNERFRLITNARERKREQFYKFLRASVIFVFLSIAGYILLIRGNLNLIEFFQVFSGFF